MADTPLTNNETITLAHMPQQAHVWRTEDDWTGVIDRKERRKLQNRQNQRKWPTSTKSSSPESSEGTNSTATGTASSEVSVKSESEEQEITELRCAHAPPNAREYLRWFEATLHESYLLGSPKSEHLIGLTRLNVHRAISENIRAIGMDVDWMSCDDSISIFNLQSPIALSLPSSTSTTASQHLSSSTQIYPYTEKNIPPALRPTEIQKLIPHHPWLDFFPFPRMRDCLITASHLFDDDELCHDLMAFWDTRNTGATLIVWGQPWDPSNWEVTEGFLRRWGWALRGSSELLVSTNYWRRRRGERGIVWGEVLPFAKLD
ncbi:hypothetical protein BJX66DRAFT_325700 [Aspergillus keveii]|uniref:Uncharacterized protein n=1 Tax=Aspergillus keveii TaxID=714993 RepID=A0ABR4G4F8_9EURO